VICIDTEAAELCGAEAGQWVTAVQFVPLFTALLMGTVISHTYSH
jgi:hypothetical protein